MWLKCLIYEGTMNMKHTSPFYSEFWHVFFFQWSYHHHTQDRLFPSNGKSPLRVLCSHCPPCWLLTATAVVFDPSVEMSSSWQGPISETTHLIFQACLERCSLCCSSFDTMLLGSPKLCVVDEWSLGESLDTRVYLLSHLLTSLWVEVRYQLLCITLPCSFALVSVGVFWLLGKYGRASWLSHIAVSHSETHQSLLC